MTDHLIEKVVASDTVFEGVFLKVVRDDVQLPDGKHTAREYIRHPGAVAIVALTDQGRVVMEHQYRHPLGKVFLEIPAGKLDPGEPPLTCAQRELREETGFEAETWHHLGVMHPCIGYADEAIELYLARGLKKVGQTLDDAEFLEVVEMELEAVLACATQGKITDGKTLSALFLAERALRQGF